MTYQIVFTKRAVKDLEKIEEKERKKIIQQLKENLEDPLANAKKLTNPKLGTYRYKIGDYRVIFDLEERIIIILRVGHRKTIYR